MRYDTLIRGGTLIDGTGGPARTADLGIVDGRIAAVGRLGADARRVVDADGLHVLPGFTDLHTHYDGQASWDPDMAPSVHHGVTTAVMGNCGVGFAPVRPADRQRLIALMEGVEDIPGAALAEGLRWGWEDFTGYTRFLDEMGHSIDLAVQVPHDALRVFAMGERAQVGVPATAADIAEMARLLGQALDAGAVGFSTGRTDNHRAATGEFTPSAESTRAELEGLAAAFRGRAHGVIQAVSDFDMAAGPEPFDAEFDLLQAMARASGRPVSVSLMQRDGDVDQWQRILRRVEAADAAGDAMRVQVAPRGIGVLLGLQASFHPLMGFPAYKEVSHLPLPERVAALRDPGRKARLLREKHEPIAGDGTPIPKLADTLLAALEFIAMRFFELGDPPRYEQGYDDSLAARALRERRPVLDLLYDRLLAEEGRNLLYFPIFNYAELSLDRVGEMMRHPLALPGLSDGGAHVGTVCDASFPTFLLSWWGRDRPRDRLPIERLVRWQARDTARFAGLHDRGELAPGQRADLNLVDLPRLGLRAPRVHCDLPAGGARLLQESVGYHSTWVAGVPVVQGGALTGARPGRIARPGPPPA
jgi:N-acyl-D-aspartate/D-glutamate deacylase